ncbi:MAG: sulfite exporter TauE/SafE family protein [Candidatus Nanopelagicales bacterium]|nr:sulfite exporter TauE/SafE family protein [Candidatus Nanopelagicales bacterium]
MHNIDWFITVGGLFAGFMVGLTGMGGAVIVTPMLIFIFGIPAPIAVSTDVVSAAVMKPVGAGVHLARRTPHMRMVFWLCVGSIPGVLIGTLLFRQLVSAADGTTILRSLVGVALLVGVVFTVVRLRLRKFAANSPRRAIYLSPRRRALIAVIGLVVGTMVGITSVGSGTLISASLIVLYPAMLPSRLVGTDLVQAVPLLAVGALAHWGLGEIDWLVVAALLIGQIPGVWLGARVSSRYNGQALRYLLMVLVCAAGLALLGTPPIATGVITAVATVVIGVPVLVSYRREARAGALPADAPEADMLDPGAPEADAPTRTQ